MDFLNLAERVDVFYIISQLFALTGLILSLIAQQQRKKVSILKMDTMASTAAIFHYLFLGAWTGVASKVLSTTRNGFAVYEAGRHKVSKVLPILFVVLYIIVGVITYESPISLIAIISPIIFTMAIYLLDAQRIRKTAILTSAMWLIYNAFVFSIVGVLSEIIFIVNTSIAVCRYRNKK